MSDSMPAATRFLREATTTLVVVLLFIAAIALLPLAAFVMLIAFVLRRLNPDGEGKASLVWFGVVGLAGMVFTILVLPVGLLWDRITGKPSPPSPQLATTSPTSRRHSAETDPDSA
jgi:hypothetical protein